MRQFLRRQTDRKKEDELKKEERTYNNWMLINSKQDARCSFFACKMLFLLRMHTLLQSGRTNPWKGGCIFARGLLCILMFFLKNMMFFLKMRKIVARDGTQNTQSQDKHKQHNKGRTYTYLNLPERRSRSHLPSIISYKHFAIRK